MKAKDKKVPKSSENNYIVSSSAEAVLYGILFTLLGLIGLLNKGIVGSFITYCVVYLFGAFYILFFLFIVFFGLYLMIKKKFYKLQIDLKLLGFLLMLLAFSIGASLKDNLTFQSFYTTFSRDMKSISSSQFQIESVSRIPLVGGGIIGYALAAILNNALTVTGTKIVIVFVFIVGFLLVFNGVIKFIFKHIISFHRRRKEMRKNALEASQKEKETQKKQFFTPQEEENTAKFEIKRNEIVSPSEMIIKEERQEVTSFKPNFFDDEEKQEVIIPKKEPVMPVKSYFEEDEEPTSKPVEEKKDFKMSLFDDEIKEAKKDEVPSTSFSKTIIHEEIKPVVNKPKLPYMYPPIALLSDISDGDKTQLNITIADEYVQKINELFADFKIGAQVISYTIGPSVTRFDVKTNPGVKLSSIAGIQNELAAKLDGNKTVRVELIIEGKDTSGIEVGNKYTTTVPFKDVFKDLSSYPKDKLLIPLGKDISDNLVKTSIDELPHLLVAGTTGSGKSVFVHSIIMSLIMRNTPDELRLMLIDPKKVEFTKYHDLPHLLCPTITDADEATVALKRLVDEMERRYELFATKGNGASKYSEYIEYAKEHNLEQMPVIVVIVDEFADLMLNGSGGKEIETAIKRIGQKARASGIYMILATQRPSVQVVTGDIKANIPSRIALSVASQMDSRVILDEIGAETLLGKGDLLARVPISKSLIRAQSAFVPSKDIMAVCDYIRAHSEVEYYAPFLDLKEHQIPSFEGSAISSNRRTELDPLHEEVKQYILETKVVSTSKIQSTFTIGFSRADYILDCLEREGIVKRMPNGRRIFVGDNQSDEE